jgi:hypothetical protein
MWRSMIVLSVCLCTCQLIAAAETGQVGASSPAAKGDLGAPLTLTPSSEPSPENAEAATHPGAGASNEALAKAAQNPVANLISVPLQNNAPHSGQSQGLATAGIVFQEDIP